MTLYEFKLLSDREQLDLLQDQGTYIGKRKERALTLLLFQLEGFYIEIWYQKHRFHILRVRCFSSTLLLEPYLDQIDIEQSVA